MKILITGGAGFIGSNLVKYIIKNTCNEVINIDKLTYAGNTISLKEIEKNKKYFFEKIDICDYSELKRVFNKYQPDSVFHLAAESHVDKSIINSNNFIQTNIIGTYNLLEVSRLYLDGLTGDKAKKFKFLHISTDEVFGDLDIGSKTLFTENTAYNPSSPYSASKASSDHLVRSWNRTFNFPAIVTNCSNNYGPFQYPEKLIPVCILNAINEKKIPIYGRGDQIRDWLHVEDHVEALYTVFDKADVGTYYNIGGNNEIKNIDLVMQICDILDELNPFKKKYINSYKDLITYVQDRPGHDYRYAIDTKKIKNDLHWQPKWKLNDGIKNTIKWYLDNNDWLNSLSERDNL